jgi:hypothetical protein
MRRVLLWIMASIFDDPMLMLVSFLYLHFLCALYGFLAGRMKSASTGMLDI